MEPTPGRTPAAGPPLLRTAALLLFLTTGVLASAGPALAAQDPSRPQASVTRGPSCEPGGVEVTVVAGSVPYHVVLATTRHPEGEDAADVAAGASVVLHTGDVAWGETIDSRLLYSALDGSGATSTDELDDWTMTRPSEADCAAIASPSPSGPAPGGAAGTASGTSATAPAPSTPVDTSAPGAPSSSAPAPVTDAPEGPAPQPPAGDAPVPSAVVAAGAAGDDGASARAVGAGRPITVRGSGFTPGENVVLRRRETGTVLASGLARSDGSVRLSLTVPAAARGATRFDLVGTSGTSAPLQLQVAALTSGAAGEAHPFALPPLAALLALIGSGGGLVSVVRRATVVRAGALR